MKKLVSVVLLALAVTTFIFTSPALAADGKAVFSANCAACHLGGKNTVNPQKTLKKEDLEKYSKFSEKAIYSQAMTGAGAMPSFKRLGDEKLKAVAAYVFKQSEAGWPKK